MAGKTSTKAKSPVKRPKTADPISATKKAKSSAAAVKSKAAAPKAKTAKKPAAVAKPVAKKSAAKAKPVAKKAAPVAKAKPAAKKTTAPAAKKVAAPKAVASPKKAAAPKSAQKAKPAAKAKAAAAAAPPPAPKVAAPVAVAPAPRAADRSPSRPAKATPPAERARAPKVELTDNSRPLRTPARTNPPGQGPNAARRVDSNDSRLLGGARRAEDSEARWDLPPSNFGASMPELKSLSLPQTGPWNIHDGMREARATRVDKSPPPMQELQARPAAVGGIRTPGAPSALDLPSSYGETDITAIVRDPEWLFVYWDISDADRAQHALPRGAHNRPLVLRLIPLVSGTYRPDPAKSPLIVPINDSVTSWYVKAPSEGRLFLVELATYSENGDLAVIARSEPLEIPRAELSNEFATDDAILDDERRDVFNQILRLSGGPEVQRGPNSEDFVQVLQQRLFPTPGSANMFSGILSSGVIFGGEQPVIRRIGEKGRDFWLEVGVDVIVYGATEPDAAVKLMGRPIRLTPDGRFRVRMTFPDGTIEFPVEATSADQVETRTVMPVVNRKTT